MPLVRSFGSFRIPTFSMQERRALWIALDLIAVNGALLVSLILRTPSLAAIRAAAPPFIWGLVLSVLWLLLASAWDVYEPRTLGRFGFSAAAALKAGVATAVLYLVIPYLTPPLPTSRSALFTFPLLIAAFLLLSRGLGHLFLARSIPRRRALIIGAGWAGRTIAQALSEAGDGSYAIVGFVDDDPAKQGTKVLEGEMAYPVLGDRTALPTLIAQHRVSTLILAITREVDGNLLQILTDCLELGVEIVPMPVLYEQLTGRVPIEHVGENWYVAMPVSHPLTRPFNRAIKRAMDIALASIGLLVMAPLFPFIALAIYLDSPGPIFYTQERVGQGGRIFRIYKFRSMVPKAERGKAVWAQVDDPRVTRVGRFLRRTHLDEFPQLWNVLRGEMSVVGPRPERPEFVAELAREIPFYRVRHAIKPGMAGWALVRHGYVASKEEAMIRLQYDLYYIKHWSPWLDLVILLKTVMDTLAGRGRA